MAAEEERESMNPPSIQGLIGGSPAYPEYEMMIGAAPNCMDVHALGEEKAGQGILPAMVHMGFSEEFASKVTEAGMDPSTTLPEGYLDFMTTIKYCQLITANLVDPKR